MLSEGPRLNVLHGRCQSIRGTPPLDSPNMVRPRGTGSSAIDTFIDLARGRRGVAIRAQVSRSHTRERDADVATLERHRGHASAYADLVAGVFAAKIPSPGLGLANVGVLLASVSEASRS